MGRISYHIIAVTFLFQLLNYPMPCQAKRFTSLATDQLALLSLKVHVTLDPYTTITSNWTGSTSVCTWIGVTCSSRHHRVAALNISYMGITGTIPPELGNLSFLVSLDLNHNHFRGNLPLELSQLRRLKFLSLKANNFIGEIPSWFGLLDKLTYLSIRNNSFTGFIPNSISNLSNIQVLDFTSNPLQGTIPENLGNLHSLLFLAMEDAHLSGFIPATIFNLSMIKVIAFSYNKLGGSLPINMCHNHSTLEIIYLGSNQLSGEIPSNLFKCSQLQSLSLAYNLFSGQIPKELGILKDLEILEIGVNNINGTIPQEMSNLQNLQEFKIEINQITGELPINIFNISFLQVISLSRNKVTGILPRSIGNLTMLKELYLIENEFTGVLPQEISQLDQLEVLELDFNRFNGEIPQGLFNISTLRVLGLVSCGLASSLPPSLGYGLPALEELLISRNYFSGVIPNSISNCSKLRLLSLGKNRFTGFVPRSLGNLRHLKGLSLGYNNLMTESSSLELNFITSLTNCNFLIYLSIDGNPFDGIIPRSIGNLSTSLLYFYAGDCNIKGIPNEIGNLTNLVTLSLKDNQFRGNIPVSIKHLDKLQGLFLQSNKIRGSIPEDLCNLHNLAYLNLSQNQFLGAIPECLGNVTSLRHLYLGSNMLTSTIPSSIWLLKDLLVLDLSSNFLNGSLSLEVSNLGTAILVDLSRNQFFGYIPSTIGKLQNLGMLNLGYNKLQGIIPVSIGSMINLQALDLSHNNLSGSIPMSLQKLQVLNYFNVSFNALTGEIPIVGPFRNFSAESFKANKGLCGIVRFQVPPCHKVFIHGTKRKRMQVALCILFGIIACIMVVSLTFIFIVRYKRKEKEASRIDTLMLGIPERISYYKLLQATEYFDESNILGIGSFGSVYKGTFKDGKVFAIKVFNLQLETTLRSFDVECEVLRSLRHRNLTKVLGSCSNENFKALVLEYMPQGNLEKWLYSHNYYLDITQRMNIMIDVASALEYLHHGYSIPIVHCDLKPSNVLLDGEMVAHISDFGIAKLLGNDSIAHTNTLATPGYIAPEYGLEGSISTRCDVYSYGIIVMETFTRERPCDEMFQGSLGLKTWVERLFLQSLDQIIDANLLNLEEKSFDKIMQCVSSILELALKCSKECPSDRMNIKDVGVELKKIKCRFVACSLGM